MSDIKPNRHVLWEPAETQERMTAAFDDGMASLETVEWNIRDLLDVVEELLQRRPAA